MFGIGIVRGLWLTFRHMCGTYWDDLRWWGRRYRSAEGISRRASKEAAGIFTIQYPEEKLPVPEAFRAYPFLVYESQPDGNRKIRCTACGICAKVCPPQCIWIRRAADPATGKPKSTPELFFLDMDLCMSCGLCVEYCPFDAIQMDHVYELAAFDRKEHILDLERLLRPDTYYAETHPERYHAKRMEREAKAGRMAGGSPA
jgi:NADH-quinone oxidoreductase subunit I